MYSSGLTWAPVSGGWGGFCPSSQGAPVTREEIPQVFRCTVGRVPFSSRQANTHISTSKIAPNHSLSCNFARLNTHTSGVGSPSRHRLVTVSSSSRVARRASGTTAPAG